MRTDSIKKYVLPNIPYLFVLWACLKLGTAYRLAAGADFAHKLMGLGQTIGPAFADFAPGLNPFDWLIGIVGAVGFRLLIYFKSKNAKKFRRDEEYGSARWGTEKDIKPFIDPKFENNIILTGTEFLTMNTRPKNPANARNLNACVIGSSGSGKTRFWLTPQILQASADKNGGCSYVCVDPKGGVLSQVGSFLQRRGYRIKVFNSIDFTKSMHYNPLAYIKNEADILKFVDALISNTKGEGKEGDPFWTKAETLLYCALIAYIIFEGPAEDRNMNTLVDMISGMEVKEDDENYLNAVDYMFKGLEKRKPDCFAVKQYRKYKLSSGKTAKSILISCGARLAPFDIERSKYITFGIPAEGIAEARPRLERVEADVMGNFKRLGVPCEPMDGRARLALLYSQMHPGNREPFRFSWKDIPQTGLGTKDFIAPDSFDFRQSRSFRIGQYWGAVSYLQILASELSDKLLAEILEMDAEMTVTLHIQTVDQLKAIKTIKGKISDIGKMKVEEQRKAVRAGYDPDILPPDLITFSKDAAELLADLQSRNERMFLLTFTVVNFAPTRQRLENDVFTVGGIAQKYNCSLKRLDWQQEQGFVSSLALGYNEVEIQRGMTTSSTAIFIPFMTRELRMAGQALYYGMNALSHNVIMADRKKLKSANGLYLGSTGSGKSFAAKRELLNVFLAIPQDRILIVDPMGEYAPLVRRLGGQVIEIAPDSPHHLNPMDVELNMTAGESPLSMKADFLLSLCELVVGGKDGLQPIEKTVVDRCVRLVYREQALGIATKKTPLLQDLYEELLKQPEPEARRVATALELYCTGSLNLFNHPTNVKTDSRVVCIVLKNMGENLRKIAMHITNEFVSQAVDTNFREGVATWCYFDEFHVLLRDPLTASYFVAVWKMLRKKGCVPSALTQNVKDLLASREIENILDNTDFMILLSQAQSDRTILAKQLGISEHQLSYITHSNSGEGLLFYGNVTIPFVDRFPKGEIYNLLTTRPEDVKNEAKTE